MTFERIRNLFLETFPHTPTNGQNILINKLSEFILSKNEPALFLLKGYAGTGKTSMVSAMVHILPQLRLRSVLLAPTGRAAKVLTSYSRKKAHTIHRFIYWATTGSDGRINLVLQNNKHKNTIFIVDEASMIPDGTTSLDSTSLFNRSLLEDLFNFVYNPQNNCKIILIGDTAQLPPVGLEISPALEEEYLKASFGLYLDSYEITEVVRQSLTSGILANATYLRRKLAADSYELPFFGVRKYQDINKISGLELEDLLNQCYSASDQENTIVVTRSNKMANIYNQQIRVRILYQEDEIASGDFMMIVKNNYFWLPENSAAGFMANGDIIQLTRIRKIEEMYGFRFADVSVRMVDYPDEPEQDVKIILDTIMTESPALPQQDNNRLFNEVMKDYEDIPNRRKRLDKLKLNPYFNALQIKFAYAMTCHKTQGGQWENVFVDQGYIRDDMINKEYIRWMYTALTRASKNLFLVNFNDKFFG